MWELPILMALSDLTPWLCAADLHIEVAFHSQTSRQLLMACKGWLRHLARLFVVEWNKEKTICCISTLYAVVPSSAYNMCYMSTQGPCYFQEHTDTFYQVHYFNSRHGLWKSQNSIIYLYVRNTVKYWKSCKIQHSLAQNQTINFRYVWGVQYATGSYCVLNSIW